MNENSRETCLAIDLNSTGLFLFCIYIFISYLANDVLLPSVINTYALYAFLGYSVIYIFIKKKLIINLTVIWLALFMLFSLLSMLYSPEKSIFSGTFYFLIVNFIIVLLLSQYEITLQTIERIGWIYSISAFALVFSLAITGNIFDSTATGRLGQELLGNANILATMLMTSTLYTIWLLVYQKCNKISKLLLLLCLIAEYLGMFLSGGRKYILVPIFFMYILLLFKRDKKGRKHIIKYTIIILVIAVIIWNLIMNIPAFYESIGSRMESFFAFLNGDLSQADGSSKIRSQMIDNGLQKWLSSPIWGYGFDSFKYFNQSVTGHFYYSHNNFVELLYNTGILGFIAYYWYYIKLFFTAWNNKNMIQLKVRSFVIAIVFSMLFYEIGAINYTSTSIVVMLFLSSIMLQNESAQ